MASRGIPVSCEVDIYGALSEYIGLCISNDAVTLLDINNSVPKYIYDEDIKGKYDYKLTDTFMGFHCGNTPACKMCESRAVKYQLIQHRLLEPAGSEPDFTRGTLEGDIAASDITFYRLQCNSEGELVAYVAEGEVLRCTDKILWWYRYLRYQRNGKILSSRTDRGQLSASRSSYVRTLRKTVLRSSEIPRTGCKEDWLQPAGRCKISDRKSMGLIYTF